MFTRCQANQFSASARYNQRLIHPWLRIASKRSLSAVRAMSPTLVALSIAGVSSVAHAQGTMDFSGAKTLMGTFKTFAMYAGAVICFGGLIFAGIRMMSVALSGRYSGPLRRAVWCRSARLGSRLDSLSYRAVDVGGACDHDQAGRTVTNQSGAESAEGQTWSRPLSMDGDRFRLRNGFPRRVSTAGDVGFPDACRRRMAHRPQTPKDVPTLGPEPQPEELL